MKLGKCALCQEQKFLEKSHIIPNAVFRAIKRKLQGKTISISDNHDEWIRYSGESWSEYLLCGACEDTISAYESYAFDVFRGQRNIKQCHHKDGMSFSNVEYARFKIFLLSILWRAAVSRQEAFAKVKLPPSWEAELRVSIMEGRPLGALKFGCKILRLNDQTKENGFSLESLKQLIVSPFPRNQGHTVSYIFVFEGLMLEFFCPAIPYRESKTRGIIRPIKPLFIPYKSILDVPELRHMMMIGYHKHAKGMVAFENKQK